MVAIKAARSRQPEESGGEESRVWRVRRCCILREEEENDLGLFEMMRIIIEKKELVDPDHWIY